MSEERTSEAGETAHDAALASRQKILVITGFWPENESDSYGNFIYDQTEALVSAGCAVSIVVPRPRNIHRWTRRGVRALPDATVVSAPFFSPPARGPLARWGLRWIEASAGRSIRRSLTELPDTNFAIAHLHGVSPEGLSLPFWRDSVRTGRTVMTVHGLDPRLFPSAGHAALAPQPLNELWNSIDRIVAVGRPILPALSASGVPPEKLDVIANGARIPPESQWSARQNQTPGRRVILSVSNLTRLKGVDLTIRALAQIADDSPELVWQYRIIGAGPEEKALRSLVQDLGLAERVLFLGRLPHAETMREMSRADIFCLPSWGEAFGIVYPEAMGRGRPVIGCRDWGAAETVRDGLEGILVTPGELSGLGEALSRLIADPELCERMGRSGRKRAEEFTWRANQRAYFGVYFD